MNDAFYSQMITTILYSSYFAVIAFEPWIKKIRILQTIIDYFGVSGMIVAVTFYLLQIHNGLSIVNTRVSPEGVHSICMVLFLVPYFIFAYLPDRNTIRGMTLVVYLISLHEIVWNILFYGLVKPWLASTFLTFGLSTICVMIFTVIASFKRYRNLVKLPSLLTVAVALIHGWIWISIGFPITVSTFETPYLTIWFRNELVNMVEIGFAMSFIGAFVASYFTRAMLIERLGLWWLKK